MCVNICFYPLIHNEFTGKNRILFTAPFDLFEYDQLKDISHDAFIKLVHHRRKLNLQKDDTFIKLVQVPCGYCSECLRDKTTSTMFRIMKECEDHVENWFVTLTYNDENLPENHSLIKDEISRFNKKLKVYLQRKNLDSSFRFYGVGEYGSQGARPHYHVIYFGLPIPDLKFFKKNEFGDLIFTSEFLSSVWNKGFVTIGEVTPRSAAYVARYSIKKQLRTPSEKEDLLNLGFIPEFSIQSMRPGIGFNFLSKSVVNIENKVYNDYIRGQSYSLPKYYKDRLKKLVPEEVLQTLEERSNLFRDIRLNKILLTYGHDYYDIIHSQEEDIKRRTKLKRKGGL